jgi:hypothetical protein
MLGNWIELVLTEECLDLQGWVKWGGWQPRALCARTFAQDTWRFYHLFGKPIETKGREEILKDKEVAKELYLQVKSEVESSIAFLLKKRKEDPYRSVIDRTLYKALHAPSHEVPTLI